MFDLIPFTSRRPSLFDPFWAWSLPESPGFRADIREEADRYLLEADLPGCAKEDVEVTVNGDRLTVTACRRQESGQADGENRGYLRQERSWGSWQRSFALNGVDADRISAAYRDGVLTLTLPKKADQPPAARRLEIE